MITADPANNVTDNIFEKIGANLHHQPSHPIGIIKEAIYSFFHEKYPGVFTTFDDLYPVVSAEAVRSFCPSHCIAFYYLTRVQFIIRLHPFPNLFIIHFAEFR